MKPGRKVDDRGNVINKVVFYCLAVMFLSFVIGFIGFPILAFFQPTGIFKTICACVAFISFGFGWIFFVFVVTFILETDKQSYATNILASLCGLSWICCLIDGITMYVNIWIDKGTHIRLWW